MTRTLSALLGTLIGLLIGIGVYELSPSKVHNPPPVELHGNTYKTTCILRESLLLYPKQGIVRALNCEGKPVQWRFQPLNNKKYS